MKQTFYHGTSPENWEKIKQEGILFGVRNAPSRCTYLACNKDEVKSYGDIVLKVMYDPIVNKDENNWCEGCWQVRVYEPISLSDVEVINDC